MTSRMFRVTSSWRATYSSHTVTAVAASLCHTPSHAYTHTHKLKTGDVNCVWEDYVCVCVCVCMCLSQVPTVVVILNANRNSSLRDIIHYTVVWTYCDHPYCQYSHWTKTFYNSKQKVNMLQKCSSKPLYTTYCIIKALSLPSPT